MCCCDVRLLTQILPAAILPSAVTQWAVNWLVELECIYCVYQDQIGNMEMERLVLVLATEQQSAAKQTNNKQVDN